MTGPLLANKTFRLFERGIKYHVTCGLVKGKNRRGYLLTINSGPSFEAIESAVPAIPCGKEIV
jgi:hypothetical protein